MAASSSSGSKAAGKKAKDKVVTLRALLIKAEYTDAAVILKNSKKLTVHKLHKTLPTKGVLYVKPQIRSEPTWVEFIQPHIGGDLTKLRNAGTAAVLLAEVDGRLIAFTFGYGRAMLNLEVWERDFGLKVVLNTVSEKKLRSVDCRNFEELTLQTRRQISQASGFDRFGLNVAQDLVRQVAGVPEDEDNFARRVAGSDGLMFAAPLTLPNLGAKCSELLAAYNSDAYKGKGFGFIDFLQCERDPTRIADLNAKLVGALTAGQFDGLHLAPPEPIDDEDIDCFTFSPAKGADECQELEIEPMLAALGTDEITWANLRALRVCVRHPNSVAPQPKWSVTQCLVYELMDGDTRYVLTCGEWYRIHKDFAEKVASKVTALSKAATLTLPPAPKDQDEGTYNTNVSKSHGFVLLDQRCSRALGDAIEPCDLFTPAKQFVHVKRKTRSATLSHLFSQGAISADCFVSDDGFRKDVKKTVTAANGSLGAQMPDDRPNAAEYEVIYAILSKPHKDWPLSLPFFSQLNLMNAADHLERMNFKVSLVHVTQN